MAERPGPIDRRPAFWIALLIISAASAVYAYRNFARAFPIVTLDLRMSRQESLAEARRIADAGHLGPPEYRQATSFDEDEEAQSFVELEGGGKDVFNRLVREGPYFPYAWRVRHFREGETNETTIGFTPAGQPYGFDEKLKEDAPGADLSASDARAIAERDAARDWRIRLADYTLVEQAQEKRPGGRRDHTFVYERPERLGDGRYRLQLVVSGDRLTQVTHFLKIPEAFTRRYETMRSANRTIGLAASVAMVLLYVGGGCAFGLFVLLRQRYVLWRQPVAWGVFVAFLQLLASLNEWPLTWMFYDTALSMRSFVVQQLTFALVEFAALSILFSASFMAAESLTRRAFSDHPQLWRLWTRDAASTLSIAGRTIAGYLLIAVFFAYDVFLYFYATRRLGWWAPSEALFHPNVLATYVPWLSAIARSFQAGFWEESLFRAVPIAGAALIGDRLGHRRTLIVVGFVAQALVFGAGHAPYPNQPAYARPLELVLPSIGFGLIYLRYGLLPGIILHFGFDLTFFALPLFVASAPGIWIQRVMILVLGLVPIWVVLVARWRTGRWLPFSPALSNGAWRPPDVTVAPVVIEAPPLAPPVAAFGHARILAVVGALMVGGLLASEPAREVPPLQIDRPRALDVARGALEARSAPVGGTWKLLTQVEGTPGDEHTFVRQTAGDREYAALLGQYLPPPRWRVRDVTFQGDVAERAEEWAVIVDPSDSVPRVGHTLPESRSAPSLDEPAARQLARMTASREFGIEDAALREVSASPQKLPARTDWRFTFEDTRIHLPQGQARIAVAIAGQEIAGARRFVYVPEAWSRDERSRAAILGVVRLIGAVTIGLVAFGAAVVAIVFWSRGRFAKGFFLRIAALVLLTAAVSAANAWPEREGQFVTAIPYAVQVLTVIVASTVLTVVQAGTTGLLAGLTAIWSRERRALDVRTAALFGVGLGLTVTAIALATARLPGATTVRWPAFAPAGTFVPLLAVTLAPIPQFAFVTTLLSFVIGGANVATSGWTRRQARFVLAVALFALAVGVASASTASARFPAVAIASALYAALAIGASRWILRFDLAPIPIAVATTLLIGAAQGMWARAYPGAVAGHALAGIVTITLAWWWVRALAADLKPTPCQS